MSRVYSGVSHCFCSFFAAQILISATISTSTTRDFTSWFIQWKSLFLINENTEAAAQINPTSAERLNASCKKKELWTIELLSKYCERVMRSCSNSGNFLCWWTSDVPDVRSTTNVPDDLSYWNGLWKIEAILYLMVRVKGSGATCPELRRQTLYTQIGRSA